MVTESPTSNQKRAEVPVPLIFEIVQGNKPSQQFPVRVRSLSARGVILASSQVPDDLILDGSNGRNAVIHLPRGEIREIRGSLLWARSHGGIEGEVVFGMELSNSNLKVRRALEEQLMAYPPDIKNLWDHWDAVHDGYEGFGSTQVVSQDDQKAVPLQPKVFSLEPMVSQTSQTLPASDHTIYWVGLGAVLAGVGVYFLAPEFYRLFGVILATYGSLTIAGKSVWSLMKKTPRSQVQI